MIKPFFLVTAAAFLSACNSPATKTDTMSVTPLTTEEKIELVTNAHKFAFGSEPKNLTVGPTQVVNVFRSQKDFVFCSTHTAKTLGPLYNNSGELIQPKGAEFTQKMAVMARVYDGDWGAGLYKRVEETKFGSIKTTDICRE